MRPGIIIQHARESQPETGDVRGDVVGFLGAIPRARWPEEAAHALTDPAGRWGPADGAARRFAPDAVQALVRDAGLRVEQVHGIRVVADLVPGAALDLEPGAHAALLALERALADRPPFRDLATQLHVLAVRP